MNAERIRLLWAMEKSKNPRITRDEFFSKFGIVDQSSRFSLMSSYGQMSQANSLDDLVQMSKHRKDFRSVRGDGGKFGRTSQLSPTEVLSIYASLFYREKTQAELAAEYNVWQSTISNIWRGVTFYWMTSPLKFHLESEQS